MPEQSKVKSGTCIKKKKKKRKKGGRKEGRWEGRKERRSGIAL